jgi:hypothetical protein
MDKSVPNFTSWRTSFTEECLGPIKILKRVAEQEQVLKVK